MRACERGHSETAQLLYEWLPASGSVTNKRGEGPVEVAKKFAHTTLASELQARQEAAFMPLSSSGIFNHQFKKITFMETAVQPKYHPLL